MPKSRIRVMTSVAMLTALSIALERLFAIINTTAVRISFGDIPIIVASIFFGPISGAVCGIMADIIGCILSGYPPNPLLMLAPAVVGVLPGISAKLFGHKLKNKMLTAIFISATMAVTNFIASTVITTIGLHILYGTPFELLLVQRIPATIISTAIEIVCLYLILKNGVLFKLFGVNNGGKKDYVDRNNP